MLRRFRSWRFSLAVSAALWAIVAVILAVTYDSKAVGGIHPGRGTWVLNRVGTLFVIAAYLTLAVAIAGMLIVTWRTLRHRQRQRRATEQRSPSPPAR